jgi:hypothetical protein
MAQIILNLSGREYPKSRSNLCYTPTSLLICNRKDGENNINVG